MEQQKLNPTIVYVLAILGLLCCCIWGFGFIPAGIALLIAQRKLKEVKLNPENFDSSSVKNMNTAKIIALVIFIINVLSLVFMLYRIYTIGWDELMMQSQEAMEQMGFGS